MKPLNNMTSSEGAPLPKRVCLRKEELENLSKEELIDRWLLQDQYINSLKLKPAETENSELVSLRESEEKLKQQQLEATRKENILVMRLTTKEQEMQEYASQIQELKQSTLPSLSQLRSALLDPAVNAMFERMRKEVDFLKARLGETQNELSAWKFTPDSNTGKRLMAKCRLLYVENEELGKLISSGRTAKLEGDLALQKNFSEEMKKSQTELDDFLLELDEDVEGMQSTIYLLQQQLKEAKDQVAKLHAEKLQQGTSSFNLPNISATYSQNGLSHTAKRTEVLHSSTPLPSSDLNQPTLLEKSVSPIIERTLSTKDKYLNGEEQTSSPGTPVNEPYDEPMQVDVRTKEESLIHNHHHIRSPERTVSPLAQMDHVEQTSISPVPVSTQRPSIPNGKCPGASITAVAESVVNPEAISSEDRIMDVDATSTSSPPTPSGTSVVIKDSSPVLIVRNCEVQEEAVNLTVTSREMSPPAVTLAVTCSETSLKRTRQVSEEPDDVSLRQYNTEQPFEPPSRVDIDADTEVQVAQTLACWAASAKNSESNQQTTTRYLGNGEVEDTSSVSEGDL